MEKTPKQYTILGEKVTINQYESGSGDIILHAYDVKDGLPFARLTLGLSHYKIPEGYVAVKDYSENEGVLQDMLREKIVAEPEFHTKSGMVQIPICKLLLNREEIENE